MKGKTCVRLKYSQHPLRRNQTGITVFYLCYHHPHLKSESRNKTEKRKRKKSFRDLSDLPIQYERIVMVRHNLTDKALSLSNFHIL